ncbi:MAG: DsrE family protein [Pseudomonadota bacterium]
MRDMEIVVLTADPERLRGALAMAAAHAALGGAAQMFFQMDAVALLSDAASAPRDAAHVAAGMPRLAALIEEALGLGVTLIACQSGLALAGMDAATLDSRIATGGSVGFLQGVGDTDRLLFV